MDKREFFYYNNFFIVVTFDICENVRVLQQRMVDLTQNRAFCSMSWKKWPNWSSFSKFLMIVLATFQNLHLKIYFFKLTRYPGVAFLVNSQGKVRTPVQLRSSKYRVILTLQVSFV